MKCRPNEPKPDETRHLPLDVLQQRISGPRTYTSKLEKIVLRKPDGSRESVLTCILDEERGVIGDRWELSTKKCKEEQIAVMSSVVAEIIANGQSLELFGDNLFVDADFELPMFPIGSQWQLGGAILQVSSEPHNGCSKFKQRFGVDALKITALKNNRSLRLRGIYVFVISSGQVTVGDSFVQLSDV
jgi:hypothetical protein